MYVGKNPKFDSTILKDEAGTPANPAAGSHKIVNRSGVLYTRNSAGTETAVSTAVESNQTTLGAVKTYYPDVQNSIREVSLVSPVAFLASAVNTGTNEITATGHGLVDGDVIQMTTTGTLPSPLALTTNYWVILVDANTFKLASSLANMLTDTEITLTTQGSGTHTGNQFGFSVLPSDKYENFLVTTGTTNVTAYLSAIASNTNREVMFKKADSGTGKLTLDPNASETMDGITTHDLPKQFNSATLLGGASNWFFKGPRLFQEFQKDVATGDFSGSTGLTITGRIEMQRVGNLLKIAMNAYFDGTGSGINAFVFELPSYEGNALTPKSGTYPGGQFNFQDASASDHISASAYMRGNGTDNDITFSKQDTITTDMLWNQFGDAGGNARVHDMSGVWYLEIDDWG